MKTVFTCILSLILCFIFSGITQAQSLEKRHQIELRLGLWNQSSNVRTEVNTSGVTTSVESSGGMGTISYGHWLQENLALNISVGSMVASIKSESGIMGVSSETAIVIPIMFDLKYYFLKSSFYSSIKPYTQIGVGTYIGSQTESIVDSEVVTVSRSEMSIGGELNTGVDFLIGRHFMAAVTIGYNLMSDFSEPIGGSKNYSGPELSFGFSYIFGKGIN